MKIEEVLIKYFGKEIIAKNNGDIASLIAVVEDKIKEYRIELDYLTMMVNCSNAEAFAIDPDGAYQCTDDAENAALVINMTTLRIKELESVLIALRQLSNSSILSSTQIS